MNENYLVSVIMPAYNAGNYIEKSIESVLNQTYKNIELIVVNDCSTDNTQSILEEIQKKDNRIRVYKNEKNSGVSFTRTAGISKSKGEWIAFLDSDDMWTNDKLEKQINFIKQKEEKPLIVFTGSKFINEKDEQYNYVFEVPEKVDYKTLLKQNVISCSSVIIQKKCFDEFNWGNDKIHEDFVLWLKILKQCDTYAYGINEPLLIYRISSNSKSGNKVKSAKMTYLVYKHMGLNIIQRIYYMVHYIIRSFKKYKNI